MPRVQRFNVEMDRDQLDVFYAFYETTLAMGALPFGFVNPRTQEATTYKFTSKATDRPQTGGRYWLVTLPLAELT